MKTKKYLVWWGEGQFWFSLVLTGADVSLYKLLKKLRQNSIVNEAAESLIRASKDAEAHSLGKWRSDKSNDSTSS